MLKFIRLLSTTGPNLARELYVKYGLKEKLVAYLAMNNSANNESAKRVHIECVRLLKVMIAFSSGLDCLLDSFEILLKHLSSRLNWLSNNDVNDDDDIMATSLVTLFQVYLRFGSNSPTEPSSSVFSILFTFVVDQFKVFKIFSLLLGSKESFDICLFLTL